MSYDRDDYEDDKPNVRKGILKGNRWDSTEKRVILSVDVVKAFSWLKSIFKR